VALVRKRLGVPVPAAQDGAEPDENFYDDDLAAAVAKFQDEKGEKPDAIVGRKTRAAFNDIEVPSPQRLLANMEMWRWMPDDLGDFHVWVNIPEFLVRVVKNGEIIHEERIITGTTSNQPPVFSDAIQTIYFNPRWHVPQSIKVNELYPSLARGGSSFQRQGLRLMRNGRYIDPRSVDWSRADIRNFDVYQPSGPGNALGIVKFTFPNKHAVYLHDTPTKNLFNAESRTFSHGCMRVRDPMRLAEVLLEQDKGWSPDEVHITQKSDPDEVPITLDKKIPVHITYLTAVVGEDGSERVMKDIYGHEQRVKLALEGQFDKIAKGRDHLAPVKFQRVQYAYSPDDWGFFFGGGQNGGDPQKRRYKKNNSSLNDFFNNMFGGF
jgi:murein L,D-transpeptidase YcbB/YkuD